MVKYGTYLFENEAYALLYFEEYQSFPVLQLYAMCRENEKLFFIMELEPGRQLRSYGTKYGLFRRLVFLVMSRGALKISFLSMARA